MSLNWKRAALRKNWIIVAIKCEELKATLQKLSILSFVRTKYIWNSRNKIKYIGEEPYRRLIHWKSHWFLPYLWKLGILSKSSACFKRNHEKISCLAFDQLGFLWNIKNTSFEARISNITANLLWFNSQIIDSVKVKSKVHLGRGFKIR